MMRRGAAIDIEAPSAILAADIHLRDTCPICREEEEFFAAQWNKFEEMLSLAQRYGCPILVAGDFFHHWKASPGLLSRTMEAIDKFPKVRITCIYGQHDLPNHNYSDRIKSGLYTLEVAGYLNSVEGGGSWGGEFDQDKDCMEIDGAKVGMIHELVFDTVPWKNCNARTAREILNAYPKCDLILTGDNHNTFTKKRRGRKVVGESGFNDAAEFKPNRS
jgi:metallophosphoesterase superfamily enzyme